MRRETGCVCAQQAEGLGCLGCHPSAPNSSDSSCDSGHFLAPPLLVPRTNKLHPILSKLFTFAGTLLATRDGSCLRILHRVQSFSVLASFRATASGYWPFQSQWPLMLPALYVPAQHTSLGTEVLRRKKDYAIQKEALFKPLLQRKGDSRDEPAEGWGLLRGNGAAHPCAGQTFCLVVGRVGSLLDLTTEGCSGAESSRDAARQLSGIVLV